MEKIKNEINWELCGDPGGRNTENCCDNFSKSEIANALYDILNSPHLDVDVFPGLRECLRDAIRDGLISISCPPKGEWNSYSEADFFEFWRRLDQTGVAALPPGQRSVYPTLMMTLLSQCKWSPSIIPGKERSAIVTPIDAWAMLGWGMDTEQLCKYLRGQASKKGLSFEEYLKVFGTTYGSHVSYDHESGYVYIINPDGTRSYFGYWGKASECL